MATLNKVMLMGNLTHNPEARTTSKGAAVVDFSVAINSTHHAPDGSEKKEVTYVDVVVWGRQTAACQQYLAKGSPVFVEGRLQLDRWENPRGEKCSRLQVRAERVQFLRHENKSSSSNNAG